MNCYLDPRLYKPTFHPVKPTVMFPSELEPGQHLRISLTALESFSYMRDVFFVPFESFLLLCGQDLRPPINCRLLWLC